MGLRIVALWLVWGFGAAAVHDPDALQKKCVAARPFVLFFFSFLFFSFFLLRKGMVRIFCQACLHVATISLAAQQRCIGFAWVPLAGDGTRTQAIAALILAKTSIDCGVFLDFHSMT